MSASTKSEDRTRLDGFELDIFKTVREHATSEQWREWLRVPLEHAAAKGDMDLFTRLMDAGADRSAGWRGCHGRTLLGAAAYGKSKEIVLALLKAGAKDEVNVRFGHKKESALHVAAAHGAEQASNTLMLAGGDPNMLNCFQQNALHLAAEAGHHGVVNTLMLKGADPNATARRGQTPLHLAAAEGHAMCVSQLLVGGADKDSLDMFGETALHLAASHNRLGAVEELLAVGANLDIRDNYSSYSALDTAAGYSHVEIVRALLAHGSSVKESDEDGCTALHKAADGEVVRELLKAGADTEAKTTDDGSTPLHDAAYERNASSGKIHALLEGGAYVNSRRLDGRTSLHVACLPRRRIPRTGAVEALLRWGADENLTDEDGNTAEELLGFRGCVLDMRSSERHRLHARAREMLNRAPADRSWRRRGWLVLARYCPAKVQLTHGSGGGNGGSSAKAAKPGHGGGDRSRDETADLVRLVGRVVDLDADCVFRLVVGFL